MTRKTYMCPLCGGTIRRVENDALNRWYCEAKTCWFHANAIPTNVAETLHDVGAGADWAADNGFWFGFLCAFGLAGTIAAIVWFLS